MYNKNAVRAAISWTKSSNLILQPDLAELLMESALDGTDDLSRVKREKVPTLN